MPTQHQLDWLHRVIWILIYGGLLTLITGIALERNAPDTGGATAALVGAVLAVLGVALIYLRSRIRADR